jgi:nitrogen regulatory protein P-II 2
MLKFTLLETHERQAAVMKLLIAIIQPTKLKAVQEALRRIGVSRLTVADAMGFARQRGQDETYRGAEYKTNLLRKVALEIAVNDDFVEKTVECLQGEHRRRQNLRRADGPGHPSERRLARPRCDLRAVA